MRVGVLALQGGYVLHQRVLESLGVEAPLIYKPSELHNLNGLIIPGGESTALLRLMTPLNWQQRIIDFKSSGRGLFGTCAGMIVLAKTVIPEQESLNLIDITVERNAYGRQRDSHVVTGDCNASALGVEHDDMVFIRAPKIISVGAGVTILATVDTLPVFVQQDNVMVASFHPEFSTESRLHQYFLKTLI